MGLIRNLFASSLIAVILSGCNLKNPACNNQHVSVIQPGPKKGEDTFVKFEAYPSYMRYNHENFGDSSRIEIGCFRFYNWGNMESYFKIPNPSFLNSSTIDSVVFSLYGKHIIQQHLQLMELLKIGKRMK